MEGYESSLKNKTAVMGMLNREIAKSAQWSCRM